MEPPFPVQRIKVAQYLEKLKKYNAATTQLNANATNSKYFVPWVRTSVF